MPFSSFDPAIKHPGHARSCPLHTAKINPQNEESARDRPAWGHKQTWSKSCKNKGPDRIDIKKCTDNKIKK